MNFWYVDYFSNYEYLWSYYKVHAPFIDRILPVDKPTEVILWWGTSWISQIFLTIAAFNLALRSPEEFAKVFPQKIKMFVALLLFFICENMVVAPNFGEALSIYPIHVWMIILALFSVAYRYMGLFGIAILGVISLLRIVFPVADLSFGLNHYLKGTFHSAFEYNARIELFLTSASMGFFLGYLYYQRPQQSRRYFPHLSVLGLFLVTTYLIFGDDFYIDPKNVFKTEHLLLNSSLGLLGVLGCQLTVLTSAVIMEPKRAIPFGKVLLWIGQHTLLIYALHRVMFIYILGPIRMYVGELMGKPLNNNLLENICFITLTLGIIYLLKRQRVLETIIVAKPG